MSAESNTASRLTFFMWALVLDVVIVFAVVAVVVRV